jgi:hypothetical protein
MNETVKSVCAMTLVALLGASTVVLTRTCLGDKRHGTDTVLPEKTAAAAVAEPDSGSIHSLPGLRVVNGDPTKDAK